MVTVAGIPEVHYSPDGDALYIIWPGHPGWVSVVGPDGRNVAYADLSTDGCVRYIPEDGRNHVTTTNTATDPEPPVGFIGLSEAGDVFQHRVQGWVRIGSVTKFRWVHVQRLAETLTELAPAADRRPTGRGYNGTALPCTVADVGPRVGERLEIHVWQSITGGKVNIVTGYLDRLDGSVAVVSPLWSADEVRINVCDIAGIWSAELR